MTIVECKLWQNPEARRRVVAQALDYGSALANWSYENLEQRVSNRLGKRGNLLFEIVRAQVGARLKEQDFRDKVSQSLREGRYLILIAGDGIREGVQSLSDLLNISSTNAFSFGLIEVALYRFEDGRLVIQPRILVKTKVIERVVTIVRVDGIEHPIAVGPRKSEDPASNGPKMHLKDWWQPILQMKFDNRDQDAPFWTGTNNVVLNTPFPGIQIKAYSLVKKHQIAVFLPWPRDPDSLKLIRKFIGRDRDILKRKLPEGTEIDPKGPWPIVLATREFQSDPDKLAWIKKMLNQFVNALRPLLKAWYEETRH